MVRECGFGSTKKGLDTMVGPEWPFLNRLAHFCLQAQIWHCRKGRMSQNREFMDKIAPRCEWSRFREWTLMLISCQVSCTPEQRLLRPHFHISTAANAYHLLLGRDGEEVTVYPFGVCQIICWMLTCPRLEGAPTSYSEPSFLQRLKWPLERPTSLDSVKIDSGTLPRE